MVLRTMRSAECGMKSLRETNAGIASGACPYGMKWSIHRRRHIESAGHIVYSAFRIPHSAFRTPHSALKKADIRLPFFLFFVNGDDNLPRFVISNAMSRDALDFLYLGVNNSSLVRVHWVKVNASADAKCLLCHLSCKSA